MSSQVSNAPSAVTELQSAIASIVRPGHPEDDPDFDYHQIFAEGCGSAKYRSKRWILTCNNPSQDPIWVPETMDYMVWQLESGAQMHTLHWHCYIRYKSRVTRAGVQRSQNGLVCDSRIAKGKEIDCKAYCTKEDTRVRAGAEYGEYLPEAGAKGKGERLDLEPIIKMCQGGTPLTTIAYLHPKEWVKYHSGILSLHSLVAPLPPTIRPVRALILWGATGTGKSYRVATQMPNAYKVRPGRDPWGNYHGEDTVWFDEFNYEKWTIFEMNEYLDQYRCKLDRRYQDAYAAWTRVVICANSNPASWYPNATPDELNAFRRRLGDGCRLVSRRDEDIVDMPPNPDFSYLVPPPMITPPQDTQPQIIVPDSQALPSEFDSELLLQ